jgi:hypothetical protein
MSPDLVTVRARSSDLPGRIAAALPATLLGKLTSFLETDRL